MLSLEGEGEKERWGDGNVGRKTYSLLPLMRTFLGVHDGFRDHFVQNLSEQALKLLLGNFDRFLQALGFVQRFLKLGRRNTVGDDASARLNVDRLSLHDQRS